MLFPDSGRVFIRALTATGENKDTNFVLSGVTEIREKIGRVCHWPSMQDEPTGSIHPIEETLNRIAWRRSHAAPCPRPQLPKAASKSVPGASQYPAHGTLHRVGARSVQGFLARLAWRTAFTVVGTPY